MLNIEENYFKNKFKDYFIAKILKRSGKKQADIWKAGHKNRTGGSLIKDFLESHLDSSDDVLTLSEKLGYANHEKLLIIHADDIGLTSAANAGAFNAFEFNIVTCGSVMVPCPDFPEVAEYCREHPQVDMGVHFTLTSELENHRWGPVAPVDKVPSLVDEEGYMWGNLWDIKNNAESEEVEIELRAQIEKALENGIKPTHLDTHMGAILVRKDIFLIYARLAKEYDIPPLLVKFTPEIVNRYIEHVTEREIELFYKIVQKARYPLLDNLILGVAGNTYEEKKAAYYARLRDLKPGVNQLIVHLGIDDDEVKDIDRNYMARYIDYMVFTDLETQVLIDELEIKLIGWEDIKEAVDF
ncbi:ChbG/HpnK family deacetylase [Candidatus Poribacteria bacterium]|nr:ChbG/HpnK family deacetylase [Candidatus Poribacteria bacterium]